ncbi:hypothetical protein BOX15_Mlig025345g1, partial [Macrostomum lignano]
PLTSCLSCQMSEQKRGSSARSLKVHAEEDFIADLEAIVERDFYPDLPKLRAQQRYLDARASAGSASVAMATPLQTPVPSAAGESISSASQHQQQQLPPSVGLDSYLTGNTSEDNASFQALLDESERRRRVKYAWFYQQADALKAIKSADEAESTAASSASSTIAAAVTSTAAASSASSSEAVTAGLDSWTGYRVRSALMYSPDDADADDGRALAALPETRRQIVHANTRFRQAPFSRPTGEAPTASSGAAFTVGASNPSTGFDGVFRRPGVPGRIGPDGRELSTGAAPGRTAAASAAYLATPSPAPGVGESPLMTWGDIDGTPCRLDDAACLHGASPAAGSSGSATPSGGGLPYFRIPAMPTVQLADRLGRQRRLARQRDAAVNDANAAKAKAAAAGGKSPSPASMGLSPAAKRLLKRSAAPASSFGDKALRASYRPSPSPSRRPGSTSAPASTRSNASLTDGLLSDA